MSNEKILKAYFYLTEKGAEPVRDWLKNLPKHDRAIIGKDIKTVDLGWPVGMPVCRHMGQGLWEVRSRLSRKQTARILFCVLKDKIVLLHGFIKKSGKTPKKDLELALNRKRNLEIE